MPLVKQGRQGPTSLQWLLFILLAASMATLLVIDLADGHRSTSTTTTTTRPPSKAGSTKPPQKSTTKAPAKTSGSTSSKPTVHVKGTTAPSKPAGFKVGLGAHLSGKVNSGLHFDNIKKVGLALSKIASTRAPALSKAASTRAPAPKLTTHKEVEMAKNITAALVEMTALTQLMPAIQADGGPYETRQVAFFLDSHITHAIDDPRVYFTEESPRRSLNKLWQDLAKVPERVRFAYVMRIFNELGRKVASRLNTFSNEVIALLMKKPDGLGAKPEVSHYVDAIKNAFYSSDDTVPNVDMTRNLTASREMDATLTTPARVTTQSQLDRLSGIKPQANISPPVVSIMIALDKERASVFNASMNEVAINFAHLVLRFIANANNRTLLLSSQSRLKSGPRLSKLADADSKTSDRLVTVLTDALKNGAKTMLDQMQTNDKFQVSGDVIGFMNEILNKTTSVVKRHIRDRDGRFANEKDDPEALGVNEIKTRGIRDANGLVGPWNSYLFSNLGTSERVVRVFASLLGIADDSTKTRFVNMYMPQVRQEFGKTLSSFISLLAGSHVDVDSEKYLLVTDSQSGQNSTTLNSTSAAQVRVNRLLKPRPDYALDKNRVPARCYLAGRRWRLLLSKAMKHYDRKNEVIQMFVERVNQLKADMVKLPGNDLERLCLPRLEVGLRGWSINGDPTSHIDSTANKFPLRSPIEGLNKDEDPFTSGARMGYRIGFMTGYNEKRNVSLEMESVPLDNKTNKQYMATKEGPKPANAIASKIQGEMDATNGLNDTAKAQKQKELETIYLAKAAYRQGVSVGARKALEVACREGYMATLKISLRAGMLLPLEAGSHLASLKGSNFARQAAGEAGRAFVNKYLMERDSIDEQTRNQLLVVGQTQGSLAGQTVGETVGAIVGHDSALEAYRRAVTRGGKMTRAKFHLDEYTAGAKAGFEHGLNEGGRVAMSSNLNPSAPRFLKFSKPSFSNSVSDAFGNTTANTSASAPASRTGTSRTGLIELPASLPTTSLASPGNHWERDLITPLSKKNIEDFHRARGHTRVMGSFKGKYSVAREVKKGLQRFSFDNLTYDLDITAIGFVMNDITYLSLKGKINNANVLHGSLVANNILDKK